MIKPTIFALKPASLSTVRNMLLLSLPTWLLWGVAVQMPAEISVALWIGVGLQAIITLVAILFQSCSQKLLSSTLIALYLTALACFWFSEITHDWQHYLTKTILIVVPVFVLGQQTLLESGAIVMRRANRLAQQLAQRHDWPTDLAHCRDLAEVQKLRESLLHDISPALALLQLPSLPVRLAALAAIETHRNWNPGQVEMVLQLAQHADNSLLRIAAITALQNLNEREQLERLAPYLHDHNRAVRDATLATLLQQTEQRWGWLRLLVKRYLSDPLFANDGPLYQSDELLPQEAVYDFHGWCAEKGVLSSRSAQTLTAHYQRALLCRRNEKEVLLLRAELGNVHTPAVLRLELGRLLQQHQELDPNLLEQLLDTGNPAPLRLIATETILGKNGVEQLRESAISALRDLARLPNREMALAAADIVQRRLNVDLGLGVGQPLPATNTRQAGDVVRRVIIWATENMTELVFERAK